MNISPPTYRSSDATGNPPFLEIVYLGDIPYAEFPH